MDPNQQAACDYDLLSQKARRIAEEVAERADDRFQFLDNQDLERAAKNATVITALGLRKAILEMKAAEKRHDPDAMRQAQIDLARLVVAMFFSYYAEDEEDSVLQHPLFAGPTQTPG